MGAASENGAEEPWESLILGGNSTGGSGTVLV